jgi:uncharacterized membrane protein YjgN (DUF898 family)
MSVKVNSIFVPPADPASHRIAFTNNRPTFRRMAMRGALLEFLTVGFYRFWLATDLRRHLWTHTSVDGDAAEYVGTAKELLIGFLFALAILAPIYFVYFLLGVEAERLQAFASAPLGILLYLFFQFATYRARRYRLTRTVWRGVRFTMDGSGWSYAWRAGLWTLFAIVTLGFAWPWRQAALERYKMRHTSYGDLHGRFDGTGWQLFKRIWWLWFIPILLLVIVMTVAKIGPRGGWGQILLSMVPFFTVLIVIPFTYSFYKASEWRWWISGMRLGDVTFDSDLGRGALFGLYAKVVGWSLLVIIVTGLLFTGWIGGAAYLFQASSEADFAILLQHLPVLIGAGVIYIIAALAFGVVIRVYLVHDIWKRVADTTTVNNLAAAGNVTGRGELAGALGEGLTDSLDVVGF